MSSTDHDLITAITELRELFPEWRMGQLIANLVQAAGCDQDGAIWNVDDQQLLDAARRLIERNRSRHVVSV